MPQQTRPQQKPRPWYLDALAAIAFFGQAVILGKMLSRALGPIGGLFVFLFNFGLAYFFAKSAWRGLMEKK